MSQPVQLGHSLEQRHVTMIAIAGVIGAGLFVASGRIISMAGPAALIAYIMAGSLAAIITRMLGEMAVASPDTGSFSVYAERAIGPWAGFTIGWLYWWTWVMVLPMETNIAGIILHAWFPAIPVWIMVLAITLFLTATNLLNVKNYGEFEFWFALIKVAAIVMFLVLGFSAMINIWPYGDVSGVAQLTAKGGFMPNGFGAVILAMFSTIFAFIGTEIAAIAAAESKNPAKQIAMATRSIMWRIFILYVGSMTVVVSLVAWDDPNLVTIGPFRYVLERMDIPYAGFFIDAIVLTAVLSCFNSGLYTASRMLFSLSTRGHAPIAMQRVAQNGSPQFAVIASSLVGFIAVIANYTAPEAVFGFLMSTTGATILLMYIVIAVSQLRMRRQLEAANQPIGLKTWFYPWLTWATIFCMIAITLMMLIREETRSAVASTTLLGFIIVGIALFIQHRNHQHS